MKLSVSSAKVNLATISTGIPVLSLDFLHLTVYGRDGGPESLCGSLLLLLFGQTDIEPMFGSAVIAADSQLLSLLYSVIMGSVTTRAS